MRALTEKLPKEQHLLLTNAETPSNTVLSAVDSPKELCEWMKRNLTYDGANKGYLRQPLEVASTKKAHCWEAVEFQRSILMKLGLSCEVLYLESNRCKTTHTALIYMDKAEVFWFEWAWGSHAGIHKYASIDDAIDAIRNAFLAQYRSLAVFTRSTTGVLKQGDSEADALARMRDWKHADSTRTLVGFQVLPTSKANIDFFKGVYPNLRHVRTGPSYFGDLVVDLKAFTVVAVLQCSASNYITALEVNPNYRRKGLATQLLKTAVNRYRNTELTVNKNNASAIELYLTHGWAIKSERGAMYYMVHESKEAKPKPIYVKW